MLAIAWKRPALSSAPEEPVKLGGAELVLSVFAWLVLAASTVFTLLASANLFRTLELQTCGPNPPVGMRTTFLIVGLLVYLVPAVAAGVLLSRKTIVAIGIALLLAFVSLGLPFVVFAIELFSAAMC